MGKRYTAAYIRFAKRLQWGYGEDEGGVIVDVDDDHAREGWSHSKAIPAEVPPTIFRRRRTVDYPFHGFRSPPLSVTRSRWGPYI